MALVGVVHGVPYPADITFSHNWRLITLENKFDSEH